MLDEERNDGREEYNEKKRMGEERSNHILNDHVAVDVLFQHDYELFPAGGGNTVCADRNDHGKGARNRQGGGF